MISFASPVPFLAFFFPACANLFTSSVNINNQKINTGLDKFSAIIGNNVDIGCNSVLFPGTLVFENVELGEYYIQELETIDGYLLAPKRTVEINYINQYTPIIEYQIYMVNKIPKGSLEFTKIDVSTSEPLPNTKIEIYTEKGELIYSGSTNEEGKIIINELPIGKYYILEKEAPEGYTLNNEKMYFEIKENGEIVKSSMKNQKIISVPNTDSIKDYKFEIIAVSVCIIGLVILLIAAKYGKK